MHICMCLCIYNIFSFITYLVLKFLSLDSMSVHMSLCYSFNPSALYSSEWIQLFINSFPVERHLGSLQFFTVKQMLQWTEFICWVESDVEMLGYRVCAIKLLITSKLSTVSTVQCRAAAISPVLTNTGNQLLIAK